MKSITSSKNRAVKKIIVSMLIASSFFMSAQAVYAHNQEDKHPEAPERIERMLDRMSEKLGLTEEQTKEIRELKQQEFEEISTIRKKNRDKIESLLTDEQKQLMKELRAKHKKGDGKRKCKNKEAED